jgi:hypothetical protein
VSTISRANRTASTTVPNFQSSGFFDWLYVDLYTTFTISPTRQGDEPPHFTYHDSHRTLRFHGNEIRSVNVPDLGTLVSVTIVLTVDTGSTTFTVLLPRVNIVSQDPFTSIPVSTEGIITVHAGPFGLPFGHGQQEFLHGDSADGDRRARCARGRLIAHALKIKSSFPNVQPLLFYHFLAHHGSKRPCRNRDL